MKPLLKNLMGNSGKDQETLDAMRAVLLEIQQEREKYEALVEGLEGGCRAPEETGRTARQDGKRCRRALFAHHADGGALPGPREALGPVPEPR